MKGEEKKRKKREIGRNDTFTFTVVDALKKFDSTLNIADPLPLYDDNVSIVTGTDSDGVIILETRIVS